MVGTARVQNRRDEQHGGAKSTRCRTEASRHKPCSRCLPPHCAAPPAPPSTSGSASACGRRFIGASTLALLLASPERLAQASRLLALAPG